MGDHLTFHFRTVCFWVLLHRQLDHCFAHIIPVTRKARSRLENLGSEVFSAQILPQHISLEQRPQEVQTNHKCRHFLSRRSAELRSINTDSPETEDFGRVAH